MGMIHRSPITARFWRLDDWGERMTDAESNLLKKYLAELIIIAGKREVFSQLGGCGEMVIVYHEDKLQYVNFAKISFKIK